MNTQFLNVPRLNVTPNNEVKKAEEISQTAQGQETEIPKMSTKSREMTAAVTREEEPKISSKFESLQISKFISPSQQNNSSNHNVSSSKISPPKQSAAALPPTPLKKSANVSRPVKSAEKPSDTTSRSSDREVAKKFTQSSHSTQKQNSTTDSTSRVVPSSGGGHGQPLTTSSASSSNSSLPFHGKSSQMMSKADQRHEVKKILETKSNILEKASRRASALNMTRLCPTLVLATGSSTLRSVRLQELNVTFVILATTAEEAEVRGGSSATPPTLLEGVANKSILLDENKDNEEQIELYFHNAADWIHELKVGVAMVHAPEGGAFKKGASLTDSRRGEGFAAALCAAYLIKHQSMNAQAAIECIKSRRPEARPSTSLVLQLMDFEEKLRLVSDKTKQSFSGTLKKRGIAFFHLDWKGKIKLAIPLSIYLMIAMLVVKIIYEVLFDQDSRSIFTGKLRQKMEKTSDDDLVCF